MASLGIKYFSMRQENGEYLAVKTNVSVSKEGVFSTTLPDNEIQKLQEYGVPMRRNRLGNIGYFEAKSLGELRITIEDYLRECISRQIVDVKTVIVYQVETNCYYVKDEVGNVFPNGTWTDEYSKTGRCTWYEGTQGLRDDPAFISLFFRVKSVITYRYASGREVSEYGDVKVEGIPQTNIDWLCSVVNMGTGSYATRDWSKMPQVAATEENAAVFVSLYRFICKANELLKLINIPENLEKLATEISGKLLGMLKEEKE